MKNVTVLIVIIENLILHYCCIVMDKLKKLIGLKTLTLIEEQIQ